MGLPLLGLALCWPETARPIGTPALDPVQVVQGYEDGRFLDLSALEFNGRTGELLVADRGAGKVYGFGAGGSSRRVLDLPEGCDPLDLAVDAKGRVLVLDGGKPGRVLVLSASGLESWKLPAEACQKTSALRLALAPEGDLYVLYGGTQGVWKRDAGSVEFHRWMGSSAPGWEALALDGFGRLCLVGPGPKNILLAEGEGKIHFALADRNGSAGLLRRPSAPYVDVQGRLWIADAETGFLKVFDAQGGLSFSLDTAGLAAGPLVRILDISSDRDHRFFFLDHGRQCLCIYDERRGNVGL